MVFLQFLQLQRKFRRVAGTSIPKTRNPKIHVQQSNTMQETINKEGIIKEFQVNEKDTGSSEVQVALLSARITHLTEHLRTHRKDFHSLQGLLMQTNRRRKLLKYLEAKNPEKYYEIVKRLKIRH